MCAIKDNVIEMKRLAHKELCEREGEDCEYCADTKVEEEVTEPWQDRPEYDDNGLPNE